MQLHNTCAKGGSSTTFALRLGKNTNKGGPFVLIKVTNNIKLPPR
jgi:hypothetical protein